MMEEQRVSLETGKILLEKNITFYDYYNYYEVLEDSFGYDGHKGDEFLMYKKGQILLSKEPPYETKYKKIGIAPTQSVVARLLRERYNLHVFAQQADTELWYYQIDSVPYKAGKTILPEDDYTSYEAALEAGLQEALKST